MHDANTIRAQLIAENTALRQHIAVLEAAQTAHTQTAEALRMRVGELIPPEDLEREPLNLAALHTGLPVVSERRFRRQDGTLLPVEISSKILSDGHL